MAVVARDARPSDAPVLAELLGQLGYPATPDEAAERLAKVERVVVAVADGVACGFASLHVIPFMERGGSWCRMTALVVDEQYRGVGVGRVLVEAVEAEARSRGCSLVEVTSGDWREDAHAFYRGLGYEEVSRRFLKEL